MSQSLANNLIHLIFSTKHREPWLIDAVRPALHAYIATVFKNLKCPVLILNSVEDWNLMYVICGISGIRTPFQGLNKRDIVPRAMPWAITVRAVGASIHLPRAHE